MLPRLSLYAIPCLLAVVVNGISHEAQIPIGEEAGYTNSTVSNAKKIAIIGAGAAGSSTAYHLRKLADEKGIPIDITIYDKAPYTGGRSTTVNVLNDIAYPVELGASIFVKVNEILYNTATELGLPTDGSLSEDDPEAQFAFGVWDGSDFAYKQPREGPGWWDMAKLFWRYGLAPLRTQRLMNTTVSAFLNMYRPPLFPWTSLTSAAEQVGLLDFTSSTGWQSLEKHGIGEKWAGDIIQSSTRVNYAQNLASIHGLETLVCMATDDAMSIKGGNWRIFDGMVKAARATVFLNETVVGMAATADDFGRKSWTVVSNAGASAQEGSATTDRQFDIVVLTAPLQFSNISIISSSPSNGPPLQSVPDTIPYVSLYVTLLATPHRLSSSYFGITPEDPSTVPSMVITTLPESEHKSATETGPLGVGPASFWSVNHLRTIHPDPLNNLDTKLHVYKIFSPSAINATFLSSMFNIPYNTSFSADSSPSSTDPLSLIPPSHLPWYHEHMWHSYPYLFPRVTFEDLRLDADAADEDIQGSFWYTSGIESFISTMETSALMGRNVATLIGERLHG